MIRNIRTDGTEFDPADIQITKEICPGIYDLLDRMNGGEVDGLGRKNIEQLEDG